MTDPNEFLNESKGFAPGCSFLRKGTRHEGYILAMRVVADMDPKTKKPKYFENSGDAKKVLVITLDTEERDDEIDDDDGVRSLWARWKMIEAIREARDEAEAEKLEIGGWLSVAYVRQERPAGPGLSGTKHFEAEYEAPEESEEDANEFLDESPEEEESPPPPRRRTTKAAPAKATKPARSRRRSEPEPEPDGEDGEGYDDGEEEAPPPPRARRKASKAPPAKAARRGSAARGSGRRLTEGNAAF